MNATSGRHPPVFTFATTFPEDVTATTRPVGYEVRGSIAQPLEVPVELETSVTRGVTFGKEEILAGGVKKFGIEPNAHVGPERPTLTAVEPLGSGGRGGALATRSFRRTRSCPW